MFRGVLVLALSACIGVSAEEPAWGKPVDGLRIGFRAQLEGKTAPKWVAVYASTDEEGVINCQGT